MQIIVPPFYIILMYSNIERKIYILMLICFFIILTIHLNKAKYRRCDWKKNERMHIYSLKMFFQSSDPALRKEIDAVSHPDHITQAASKIQERESTL